jgi:acetate kinase
LHNPANLLGIEQAEQYFPGVKQVAVFDTSFHQTMPASSYLYAIPQEYYKHYQVRRYGFHGTSHDYVSKKAALLLDQDIHHTNLITLHLGNGCSACAILNGQSVNTTMGLTPLEGLIMGTRSGNIDPGVFEYLHSQANLSIEEISTILNKQSGLLGISGFSNDMRALEQKAQSLDSNSQLAIRMFCERLAGEIARLHIHLPRLDALVFTGGIGENSMLIREEVVKLLGFLNLKIENKTNQDHGRYSSHRINEPDTLPILVIPTDEEQKIALEVVSKGAN